MAGAEGYALECAHVLSCQLEEWYPYLRRHTVKTEFLRLPEAFVSYLLEDGVVLPKGAVISTSAETSRVLDSDFEEDVAGDSAGDIAGAGGRARSVQDDDDPDFTALQQAMRDSMRRLGGAVFPKLNWSAPRDAVWATAGSLKCITTGDIIMLLKSSEFVAHDLERAFEHCCDASPNGEPPLLTRPPHFTLALRRWSGIRPSNCWRAFCRGDDVVALSHRDVATSYPFLQDGAERRRIASLVCAFHAETLRQCGARAMGLSRKVVDVYVDSADRVFVIDVGVWAGSTDSLLFSWEELEGYCRAPAAELAGDRVRVVAREEAGMRNPLAQFRGPLEVGAGAFDMEAFMSQCRAGGYSDDEEDGGDGVDGEGGE